MPQPIHDGPYDASFPAGEAIAGSAGPVTGAAAAGEDDTGGARTNGLDAPAEDAYWREHYLERPYTDDTLGFDQYRPAYRYGWEARARHAGRRWDEVERDLEREWRSQRGVSRLGWADARLAARDAWQRVEHRLADEREEAAAAGREAEAQSGESSPA